MEILQIIKENEFIFASLAGIATFIWAVYRYLDTRKREQDLKEFENYHKLIKQLFKTDTKGKSIIDEMTVAIYELRNFKRYYSFSYRVLVGMKQRNVDKDCPRLKEELDLTIKFLEKYKNKF
jgi:predicted negative regulator of RcsB-dependent stress response